MIFVNFVKKIKKYKRYGVALVLYDFICILEEAFVKRGYKRARYPSRGNFYTPTPYLKVK